MSKALLFAPPDKEVDRSLDARKCIERLKGRFKLDRRGYPGPDQELKVPTDAESVGVLAGLSGLMRQSGYMEMDLDTIFEPEQLLRRLRDELSGQFPIVALVDDAYSDYIMATYLKAGASAVVGANGSLFGIVTARIRAWDEIVPYINAFPSVETG